MADDKPYQSLYRKYRPQGPSEVLGQDHVIRALSGAVREGRLAHAFLLCGPRGTGKTSTARILAKMVNCESGPTPEPCGSCDQCVAVRDGQHLDVVEIDAASHGGVDDARDLREKAPTAPVQGREKVYIIDEAQRLSREAFDALLKVFEEPPVGVRFVLATTEPHKMPATIVGRCQRFDFRRVPVEAVAEHLERIAKDEGMSLTREAAHAIARQTEGSVRDALSLLDQASVLGAGEIGEDVVTSLIGSGRSDVQYALGDAVAVGDAKGVFELVSRLVQEGQDLRFVTNEVLAHFRNLLLVKTAPGQHDLLDVTDQEAERLAAQATKYSTPELGRVIALLIAAQTDMRWTTSPRLSLELALIRATIPETDAAPEALVSRLERLERVAGITGGGGGSGARGSGLRLAGAIALRDSSDLGERRLPVALRRRPLRRRRRDPAHRRRRGRWAGRGRNRERGRLGATGGCDEADAIGEGCRSERRRRGRARSGRGRYGGRARPGGARAGGGDLRRGRDDAAEQLADGDLAPAELGQGGAALVPRDRDARVVRRDDARARVPARATLRRAEGDRARGGAPPGAAGPVRHHARDHVRDPRARGRSRRTGRGRAAVGG